MAHNSIPTTTAADTQNMSVVAMAPPTLPSVSEPAKRQTTTGSEATPPVVPAPMGPLGSESTKPSTTDSGTSVKDKAKSLMATLFQKGTEETSKASTTASDLGPNLFQSTDSTGFSALFRSKSGGGNASVPEVFRTSESLFNKLVQEASIPDANFPPPATARQRESSISSIGSGLLGPPPVPANIRGSSIGSSLFQSRTGSTGSSSTAVKEKPSKIPEVFQSMQWTAKYAPDHVDVNVKDVFKSSESVATVDDSRKPAASTSTGSKGGYDWNAVYASQLNKKHPAKADPVSSSSIPKIEALVTAANSSSVPVPIPVTSVPVSVRAKETTANARKGIKRERGPAPKPLPPASNNHEDEEGRVFVELRDMDVICGRGGRTNKHPGNIKYLTHKDAIQQRYMSAPKAEKTSISQELVDVVHDWGGRFLKLEDHTNRWYEVDAVTARKKCSQSLREINTPEARAAKRAKYGK